MSFFDSLVAKESTCGANGPGGRGFQPGNTCGSDGGTGSAARSGLSKRDTDVYAKHRDKVLQVSSALYAAQTGGDSESVVSVLSDLQKHPDGESIAKLANLAAEHRVEKWASDELRKHRDRKPDTAAGDAVRERMSTFSHRVPKELFAEHKVAVSDIVANLPDSHAERVLSSLKEITVAANPDEVSTYLAVEFHGAADPAAGVFVPRTGQMVLDGVEEMQKAASGGDRQNLVRTVRGLAAHEIAHAIDGEGEISGSTEWNSAWESEGRRTRPGAKFALSDYGRTTPEEGFAEYVRMVHEDPEKAIRHFPRMWSVYRDSGAGKKLTAPESPKPEAPKKRRSLFDRLFRKSMSVDVVPEDEEPDDKQDDMFGEPIDAGGFFPVDTLRKSGSK